jgi:hypothetical protein
MQAQTNARIVCECIDTRIGVISTPGGEKPIFIIELYAEGINASLIKFLSCSSKTKDHYTVRHNSDFAKLYRLTLGDNPTKRFSKANQLLPHFLGRRFLAEYVTETDKKGVRYLKATYISAENPVLSSAWIDTGTLKKVRKKRTFKSQKSGDEVEKSRRQIGEKQEKNRRQVGDSESLKAPISLGLEPDFNPIEKPLIGKNTYTQDHVPEPRILYYFQLENEMKDEYYDRVIDESFFV